MSVQLLSFSLFAFIASITPGPTNLLALASGSQAGVRATVPFMIGAAAGASVVLLMTTSGLAQVFFDFPLVQQSLAWLGTIWLTVMAWQLYQAPLSVQQDANAAYRIPTWYHGAALQGVNPKTWLMALTVSALFLAPVGETLSHNLRLAVIFFAVALPCLAAWAWLGKGSSRLLKSPGSRLWFNRCLALLLAVSVWWALLSSLS